MQSARLHFSEKWEENKKHGLGWLEEEESLIYFIDGLLCRNKMVFVKRIFEAGTLFLVAGEGVRNSCVVICQRARSASYAAIR